jgi:iron complex outermembrane receptor protein
MNSEGMEDSKPVTGDSHLSYSRLPTPDSPIREIPRLSDLERPFTSAEPLTQEWRTGENSSQSAIAQAEVVDIRGIRLNSTPTGLEVILETAEDATLPTSTSTEGNTWIADIPNAVLALPDGDEFRANNPAEGITSVTVTQRDASSVRVTVTGETGVPTAQVVPSEDGLVFSLTTVAEEFPDTEEIEEIELVVTATRTAEDPLNIPRSVTVITREEIEQQTAITRNVGDILGTLVPGFGPPNRRDRTNFQTLRGRQPAVLIDGVPQRNNSSFNVQLSYIDPASIERIEVVRGPSATYGSEATGGVINIITRSPVDQGVSATTTVGGLASLGQLEDTGFGYEYGQTFAVREGNFDLTSNIFRSSTGDFFDAEGDRIPFANSTLSNTDVLSVLGKIGYDITETQRLQFTVNHTRRDRDVPDVDFVAADEPRIRSTTLDLNYTHENLLGSNLQLQAYYRDSAQIPVPFDGRDFFFDSIYQLSSSEDIWGGRLQIDTPIASTLNLLWGADYENQNNNAFVVEDLNIDDFLQREEARRIDERVYFPPYDLESLGVFAQLRWDATERLRLSGGVRHERIGFEADDFTTLFGDFIEGGSQDVSDTVFNAGIVFDATDEISLFANFTQGFALPRLSSTLAFLPTGAAVDSSLESLEPQKVDEFELGVRGDWGSVRASVAGFYNTSELGTFFIESSDRVFEVVRTPERNYGIEATLDWQLSRQWQVGGLVSWVEGDVDFEDTGDFVAQDSSVIQPLKVTAYVQHQATPDWLNRLEILAVGNRDRGFEADLDPEPIDGYIVLNLLSSVKLGRGTLQLGIENLLDNQYRSVADQASFSPIGPDPGRIVRLTYSLTW